MSRARSAMQEKKKKLRLLSQLERPVSDVLMTVRASSAHGMSYKKPRHLGASVVLGFSFWWWLDLLLCFCWLDPGFLHGICLGPIGLLLSPGHRRLDDSQSLGARTA